MKNPAVSKANNLLGGEMLLRQLARLQFLGIDFELIDSKWESATAPLIMDVLVKFKASLKVSAVWS